MKQRRMAWAVLWLAAAQPVLAATCLSPTGNFLVTARRADVAQQVARYADAYRKQKALDWLGRELDSWPEPCTIEVRVTHGSGGGATSFSFDNGQILAQHMTVEGSLERILDSVLPHEITHTIFAAHFRRPLPRWADEGGAVLSEDYQEIARHDLLVRELINGGRMIPLRRLFVLTEYPSDVMALYAQGFSVARFLVALRGKREYLDFVWDGQTYGWEFALQRHYGFRRVQEAEDRWIDWLIAGHGTGADQWSLADAAPAPPHNAPVRSALGAQPATAAATLRPPSSMRTAPDAVAETARSHPLPATPPAYAPPAAIAAAPPTIQPARPSRQVAASTGFSAIPSPGEMAASKVRASAYAASGSLTTGAAAREPSNAPPPAAARPEPAPPVVSTRDVSSQPPTIAPDPDPLQLPPKRIPIAVGRTRRMHGLPEAP